MHLGTRTGRGMLAFPESMWTDSESEETKIFSAIDRGRVVGTIKLNSLRKGLYSDLRRVTLDLELVTSRKSG